MTAAVPATPTSQVEMISPAIAEALLGRNTMNRSISPNAVAGLVADMSAGRWSINGAPICVAVDGTLLDGQHRLAAIVQAGISVPMFVARGLDRSVFTTIDAGRKRSASDVLAVMGVPYYSYVAGAAAMILPFAAGTSRHPTRAELTEFATANPYLSDVCRLAYPVWPRLTISPLAAVLFLANRRRFYDTTMADFLDGLATGENMAKGDPRLTLREWGAVERMRNRGRLPGPIYFAASAKAWTYFARGESLKVIKALRTPHRSTTIISGFDPNQEAAWP